MSTIIPHLWFDKEAREATTFYTSLFPHSSISNITKLHNTPSGDCDVVSFVLWGQKFMAISAGPLFKFNPAISFMVNFDPSTLANAKELLESVWNKLSEGGKVLMPLDQYPFSEKYGWVQDKYGLSWQLILTNPKGEARPPIMPALLYVGNKQGLAEQAGLFYQSVFKSSQAGPLVHYGPDSEPNKEGTVMYSDFRLDDTWFVAMDAGLDHGYTFNEAISFVVQCEDQEDINYFWEKLSAVPESEQCGWLKDKFGLSWQIVPAVLGDMMTSGDQARVDRLTQAFLKMKKLNIDALKKAY